MGPYTQLLIRRTAGQRAISVCCLRATAERLGWLSAFPTVWSPEAQVPGSAGRRPYGTARNWPNEGGDPSGVFLAESQYRGRTYPRLRFRTKGPWARRDLQALLDATVPEVHAIRAGRLRWVRATP
jgi:hypothetical protein